MSAHPPPVAAIRDIASVMLYWGGVPMMQRIPLEPPDREVSDADLLHAAVAMAKTFRLPDGNTAWSFEIGRTRISEPIPDGLGGVMFVKPKLVWLSGPHYLGGMVRTFDEVVREHHPDEDHLRAWMRDGEIWVVITRDHVTDPSGRQTPTRESHRFEANAVLLNRSGDVVRRGDDPALVAYRERMGSQVDREVVS